MLSGVFILSAVLKVYDFSATCDYFTKVFSWDSKIIIAGISLVIIFESLIGIIFAVSISPPIYFYTFTGGLIFGFLLLSIFFIVKSVTNCGCFGTVIHIHPALTVIKNVTLLVLIGYLFRYESG